MGIKHFILSFALLFTIGTNCIGQVAIDMGTSVLWADRNIGATDIFDAGGYFCWAETEEKSSYIKETMKYWTSEGDRYFGSYLKYVPQNDTYGIIDEKSRLDPCDDAATAILGATWRMPTKEEFAELINSCSWEISIINNVTGYLATSKINGNTLFFALHGYKSENEIHGDGKRGWFLSSDVRPDMPFESYGIVFLLNDELQYYGYKECVPDIWDDFIRKKGYNIRAVTNKE